METRGETLAAIQEQLIILAEAFGLEISSTRQEIYCEALADLGAPAVRKAVMVLIQTRSFAGNLPTVAEIRQAAGCGASTPDELALLAWAKFSWALDYAGWDNSVAFDDRAIMGAIVIWVGGWGRLKELDWSHDQMVWRQKEFASAYKSALAGNAKPPAYFPGAYEQHNRERGYEDHIPKVQLISGKPGDFRRAAVAQSLLLGHQPEGGKVAGFIDGVVQVLTAKPEELDDLPF